MKKNYSLKQLLLAVTFFVVGANSQIVAQAISEDFNDITTLVGSGWFQQNNSAPTGTNPVWFQGNPPATGGPFIAYSGADNSYVACNFNSTAGTGTISNWLVAPNRTFRNGDIITFYTRKYDVGTDYPDRLEVRLSTNGASTNVGTGATAVGDFTTLLLSINPTLVAGGYPLTWAQYTITISGLSAPTSGRMAFRYFVTNAGPTGTNSDYIGIDEYRYTPYVCPAFTLTPGGALSGATAGSVYSNTLTQTGALGAPTFAVTAGALPPGLTISAAGTISGTPTATGTFNFTVTVSDASGCSGTDAYSITVVCPANPIVFNTTAICMNAGALDLTSSASPAGGVFSGTGITGNSFDPSVGSQTITYDITDAYGCAHTSTSLQTVNTPPVVTLSSLTAVCIGSPDVTLSAGSPAGGTYSGVNVTAGVFSPISAGTTDIIYSYTDANGCTEDDTTSMIVNDLPVVSISALSSVCVGSSDVTLSGGSPAGGTYTGTNVAAGVFSPVAAGTTDVIYSYTDANGCSEDDTTSMVVNALPTVTLSALADLCVNSGSIVLAGGLPAGGTYAGVNVSAGSFDPIVVGTSSVSYTYTDANACTDSAVQTITVNPCVGLSENSFINSVKYFPNPTNGLLTVEFVQTVLGDLVLSVVDVQGKIVYTDKHIGFVGSYNKAIDLSSLSKGVYTLKIGTKNQSTNYKLVIQ